MLIPSLLWTVASSDFNEILCHFKLYWRKLCFLSLLLRGQRRSSLRICFEMFLLFYQIVCFYDWFLKVPWNYNTIIFVYKYICRKYEINSNVYKCVSKMHVIYAFETLRVSLLITPGIFIEPTNNNQGWICMVVFYHSNKISCHNSLP